MDQNYQKVKVNPFTFWRNLAILGTFFTVDFFENYTSNRAETKLKTLFKGELHSKNKLYSYETYLTSISLNLKYYSVVIFS